MLTRTVKDSEPFYPPEAVPHDGSHKPRVYKGFSAGDDGIRTHDLRNARPSDVRAHLEKVLAELPKRVQAYLEELETRLAKRQVERGKDILASLGTEVKISPEGTAEIRGDLRKVQSFMGDRQHKSMVPWLGEEEFAVGSIAI